MIKKNIEVTINSKTRQVFFEDNFLGIKGENLQGYLVFKFQDEFVNGVATLKVEQEGNKYNIYEVEKENDSYKVIIKSSLLKSPIIYMALTITESGKEDEIPIFISNKFFMLVGETIETTEEIPEEYDSWLDNANKKLSEIDNIDIDLENEILTITKKDGSKESQNVKGEPGYTPIKGKDYFDGKNGVDGKDGLTPTLKVGTTTTGAAGTNANVEMLQNGTEYTLNFTIPKGKDGTGGSGGGTSNYEDLGNKPSINNIELNGNKTLEELGIQPKGNYLTEHQDLTNYVKNTDYATSSKAGLVRPGNGLFMSGTTGAMLVAKASAEQIDKKTDNYYPIVPSNLEYAVKSVGDNYYATIQDMNDLIGDIESLLSEV